MNEKELKISAKNARIAYRNADEKGKKMLECLFGKEIFAQDIKDRVKTFTDALRVLGTPLISDDYFKEQEKFGDDVVAMLKLRVIAEALNEGWRPKFYSQELYFYPRFHIYTKNEYETLDKNTKELCHIINHSHIHRFPTNCFAFACEWSIALRSCVYSDPGLVFRTMDLADYCGTQFIDIWEKYLFA